MATKILCVDDDPLILEAFKRLLRKNFELHTATSGEEALETVRREGPFAVVVSDMLMPGMTGSEFFQRLRQISADSVRIMLTGMTELKTAMDAVNEGNIFRFLTKPFEFPVFMKALAAGVMQYRLITAEKELLERTLTGSINMLVNILEIVNPRAFSRAMRIKDYVTQIAKMLSLEPVWQYEVAAMLSQIGCVTLPSDLLEKMMISENFTREEKDMIKKYPSTGGRLISSVPRMEVIAEMISNQQKAYRDFSTNEESHQNPAFLGAQLIRIAIDFDTLLFQGSNAPQATKIMMHREGAYNPAMLLRLNNLKTPIYGNTARKARLIDLEPGMILAEHVLSDKGVLLVSKGQTLSLTLIELLRNSIVQGDIYDLFFVIFPSDE